MSLNEIRHITNHSYDTIVKYIKNIKISPKYTKILKSKQGGSKLKSKLNWEEAKKKANNIIYNLSNRDILIMATALYWGEGTKSQFNLINSDPYLIKIFIKGLYIIGVPKDRIKFSLRIYKDMDEVSIKSFWKNFLDIKDGQFRKSEFIHRLGDKKFQYGMCRVTVIKPDQYFKLLISMIDSIKNTTSS
jgi:hypothetical protein